MSDKPSPAGYLSLAYRGISEFPPALVRYAESIRDLDISHNEFTDLKSLAPITQLVSLVVDNNHINSHVKFPYLPNLRILYINHNDISNLSVFIERCAASFPDLVQLSMMNNEAAPSYFNGGNVQQYIDYRLFVISHFPKLATLDDTTVSTEERANARALYGARMTRGKKPSVKS
eukprot:m.228349 g.228349  ORF g.228349 m.228349 type:complete len:175 (+) comp11731_c0_seq1:69-593(+)